MRRSLSEIAALLAQRDHFLILTHRRPDGDTIGSAAALCHMLRQMGKAAHIAPNGDLTPKYQEYVEGLTATEDDHCQCLIAVDIADDTALLPPSLIRYAGTIDIAIDHHPSNKDYAADSWVEPGASATGEMIYRLCHACGVAPDATIFTALYLAVSTDTGCFRFSNTTALAHKIGAEAIEAGIDFHRMNTEFFSKKTRERVQIERSLFDNIRFSHDKRVAGSYLSRRTINEIGAIEDDLDNLSTLIINLEGVQCGFMLTQSRNESEHKISVRTYHPLNASHICGRFGGGGHARAAGCTMAGEPEEICRLLMEAAAEEAGSHV